MEELYTICLKAFKAKDELTRERPNFYARAAFTILCYKYKVQTNKSAIARFLGLNHATILYYFTENERGKLKTDKVFQKTLKIADERVKRILYSEFDKTLKEKETEIIDLLQQLANARKEIKRLKEIKGLKAPKEIQEMLVVLDNKDIREFCETRVKLFVRMKLGEKVKYRETYRNLILTGQQAEV